MQMTEPNEEPSRFQSTLNVIKSFAMPRYNSTLAPSCSFGPLLGRIGPLEVRLIKTRRELRAAQRLRFEVFYHEMSARSSLATLARRRDMDAFDEICDHLIVIDTSKCQAGLYGSRPKIVGTYRLLRQDMLARNGRFYSQGEFDVNQLIERHPERRFLELGRSCVVEEYRTKRTVELLWHGIWAYVLHHKVDVMFGCASLEGTDPALMHDQLALLFAAGQAPQAWRVCAHENHHVPIVETPVLSKKQALGALPPLIKGYLRLGAYIGEGAVIDPSFGTTDVLIVLPVENINPRYVTYYGENAGRHVA